MLDQRAYDAERYRRRVKGTWVTSKRDHGFAYKAGTCGCDGCKAYRRGYSAGYTAATETAKQAFGYNEDPYLGDLLR